MSGPIKIETYATVRHPEWGELDTVVECVVYLGSPENISGPIASCYPDEPAEVEIHRVTVDGGKYDGKEISWELVRIEDIEAEAVMLAEEKISDEYYAAMEAKAATKPR